MGRKVYCRRYRMDIRVEPEFELVQLIIEKRNQKGFTQAQLITNYGFL